MREETKDTARLTGAQRGKTRTKVVCPECGADNFLALNKLNSDTALCGCGAKIDVSLERNALKPNQKKDTSEYPRMLGHHKLLKLLGQGGQANVHLGIDPMGRKVAVKQYIRIASSWTDAVREALCCLRSACLNVVNTYEILEDERAIVQEYVEGVTLRKHIGGAESPGAGGARPTLLPLEQAVDIALQILRGLLVCHIRGVIHLDIKPENIIMDSSSGLVIPKITDFGSARNLKLDHDRTMTGTLVLGSKGDPTFHGTPLYAAPEQIDADRQFLIGQRTDFYQVGIVLYELLTGHLPYDGQNVQEIFGRILSGRPTPITSWGVEIPVELERIQAKLSAFDVDDRYRSAKDAIEDLEQWHANRSVAAHHTTRRKSRRARFLATLGSGILLGTLLTLSPQVGRLVNWVFPGEGELAEKTAVTDAPAAPVPDLSAPAASIRERLDLALIASGQDEGGAEARNLLAEAAAQIEVLEQLHPQAPVIQLLYARLDEVLARLDRH